MNLIISRVQEKNPAYKSEVINIHWFCIYRRRAHQYRVQGMGT